MLFEKKGFQIEGKKSSLVYLVRNSWYLLTYGLCVVVCNLRGLTRLTLTGSEKPIDFLVELSTDFAGEVKINREKYVFRRIRFIFANIKRACMQI